MLLMSSIEMETMCSIQCCEIKRENEWMFAQIKKAEIPKTTCWPSQGSVSAQNNKSYQIKKQTKKIQNEKLLGAK